MTTIKNTLNKWLYFYFFLLIFVIIFSKKTFKITIALGCILGIILLIKNGFPLIKLMIKNRYLYANFSLLIPLGLASIDSITIYKPFETFWIALIFLFIGILPLYMKDTNNHFIKLENLTFYTILFISLDAIIQWQTDYHIFGHNPVGDNRVRGIFYPSYHLSYFLGTLSPIVLFVLYFFLEKKRTILRIIGSIIAVNLFITAILIGGARAGLISLIISVLLFTLFLFIQNKIKHKLRFISILLLTCIIAIAIASQSSVVQSRFITIFKNFGDEGFFSQLTSLRPNIWYVAFKEIPNYWINGLGPLGFNEVYQTYPDSYKIFPYVYHVHLHGLEILLETGIIGFIPYLALCFYLIRRMFTAKAGNMWIMTGFIAMMPINTHVGLFEYYWFPVVWVPIMLGLTLAHRADRSIT